MRRMPRLMPVAVWAIALLLSAMALSPAPTTGWNLGAAEATLWQLMNGARVSSGLPPLQRHETLVGLARWRSGDMLQHDYFSHDIPGTGCQVYCAYDANGLTYVRAGENIGWNAGLSDAESPVKVHEAFMTSAGHRANVLTPGFTHGGVGTAAADDRMFLGAVQNTRMYTQLFLQAASAPTPSSPPPAPPDAGTSAPTPAASQSERKELAVAAPHRPSSDKVDGVSTLVARSSTTRLPARDADETRRSQHSATLSPPSPS